MPIKFNFVNCKLSLSISVFLYNFTDNRINKKMQKRERIIVLAPRTQEDLHFHKSVTKWHQPAAAALYFLTVLPVIIIIKNRFRYKKVTSRLLYM